MPYIESDMTGKKSTPPCEPVAQGRRADQSQVAGGAIARESRSSADSDPGLTKLEGLAGQRDQSTAEVGR